MNETKTPNSIENEASNCGANAEVAAPFIMHESSAIADTRIPVL